MEAAFQSHPQVKDRQDEIAKIVITTHESAMRIIDKKGPVHNPADRDQCLQYMTTIGLIFGELTADHYEDTVAADPLVDALRERMIVVENPNYSRDNLDTQKRSIANAVQVFFKDETSYENLLVEYPLRHRWRREEGILLLMEKFKRHLFRRFSCVQSGRIMDLCMHSQRLSRTPVHDFVDLWVPWK